MSSPDPFTGLTGAAYEITIYDNTNPTVLSDTPLNLSSSVDKATNIVLTFGEDVTAGTGNIILTPAGSSGYSARLIPIGGSQVSISQTVVTVDPTTTLEDDSSIVWTVTMTSGVITDHAGNNFAGLAGTTYTFTVIDSTDPTIVTFGPADGAVGVAANSDIVFTFHVLQLFEKSSF